jgi:hypothetical protein
VEQIEILQQRMYDAFDNYFAMSAVLRDDLIELSKTQNDEQHWKRNFVRTSAALFEGYTHCIREMCVISFECSAPKLTNKEAAALRFERKFPANERIRLTLRAAYRLFEVDPAPEFGDQGWSGARSIFEKRDVLMHPKAQDDLIVDDDCWRDINYGAYWLLRQYVQFFVILQGKIADDKEARVDLTISEGGII